MSFTKQERLKSRKTIARLFKEGQAYMAYPFRVVWLPLAEEEKGEFPAQMCISVSKRHFKKATDRNRIKRQAREAYRLQKDDFYQKLVAQTQQVALILVFIGKTLPEYAEIASGIYKMIKKFPTE